MRDELHDRMEADAHIRTYLLLCHSLTPPGCFLTHLSTCTDRASQHTGSQGHLKVLMSQAENALKRQWTLVWSGWVANSSDNGDKTRLLCMKHVHNWYMCKLGA